MDQAGLSMDQIHCIFSHEWGKKHGVINCLNVCDTVMLGCYQTHCEHLTSHLQIGTQRNYHAEIILFRSLVIGVIFERS